MKKITLLSLVLTPCLSFALGGADITKGAAAFEQRRWADAMDDFLEVLRQDPGNLQAHAYVVLITKEMEARRQAVVRAQRLEMLGAASRHVEDRSGNTHRLKQAILDTSESEKNAIADRWAARCEEAQLQRHAGHLLSANDLILQVLAENQSYAPAQRELSEIQSEIRRLLDRGTSPSIMERYALEGFYAYGQADYATALTAWGKTRTIVTQNYPGADGAHRLNDLHFLAYEKVAQAYVDEQVRVAALRELFDGGVILYEQKHFSRALEEFRKLAIRDPEYPQLGYYLVQTESASERERAERLGEEKRQEIDRALQTGLAALQKEQLREAQTSFERVLKLDPSHPQARSYLVMVKTEMQKRHDPKAAQMHYEAGLIAYASGKLDEAMREWNTAARMNPQHEKALNALSKVQKELALNNRDLPDETLP